MKPGNNKTVCVEGERERIKFSKCLFTSDEDFISLIELTSENARKALSEVDHLMKITEILFIFSLIQ